jgi:hypothetical protein
MVWNIAVTYDEAGLPTLPPKPSTSEKVIVVEGEEGGEAEAQDRVKLPGKSALDAADRGGGEDGTAPDFPPDPDFDHGWIQVEDELDQAADDLEEALGDRGDANTRFTAAELLKEATDTLLDVDLEA